MTWLLPAIATLTAGVAWSYEPDLSSLELRVQAVAARAHEVRENSRPTPLLPEDEYERFYEDALLHWMLDEPELAAANLWVLRATLSTDDALRPSVDELLSDCLVDLDAPALALSVVDDVLSRSGHPYLVEAAGRKLTLTARHAPESVRDVYDALMSRGLLDDPTPALAYAIGRARWALGDRLGAETALRTIPQGHEHHGRARYQLAVIQVAFDELDDAQDAFRDLATHDDPRIADLARLAVARIHYEFEEWTDAARVYRRVPSTSPWHAQALEELAWTLLRQEFPSAAASVIAELVEAHPTSPLVSRMLVVLGRVSMAQREWEAAEQAFSQALDHLERHPPIPNDHGPSARASAASVGHTMLQSELTNTIDAADRLAQRMLERPSQDRQLALQHDALETLGRLGTLRIRLLEVEATTLPDRAQREVNHLLTSARALPDLAVPTLEEAQRRLDAIQEIRRSLRGLRVGKPHERQDIDRMYGVLEVAERDAHAALGRVEEELDRRDTPVDLAFAELRSSLERLAYDHEVMRTRVSEVVRQADALSAEDYAHTLALERSTAAAGIVDASWLRLQDTRDAQATASQDHTGAIHALEASFRRMRARLDLHPESAQGTPRR